MSNIFGGVVNTTSLSTSTVNSILQTVKQDMELLEKGRQVIHMILQASPGPFILHIIKFWISGSFRVIASQKIVHQYQG